ncbi:MAG: terminase, partial [Flavobacteriia bacterium]|nr:terminase [Flavobacteriia bacterium]
LLDNNLYIDEEFYQYGMTNRDIHNKLLDLGLKRNDEIFADSAEPKSIDELHRYGWNCKPASKGKDSVLMGIDLMKRYNIFVTSRSTNTIQEFRNYKWVEDKDGVLLNKPVDKNNHSIDATRYSIFKKLSRPNVARYAIR